jgi:DNA repair protein RecN (Recombination protein N)
MRPVLRELHIAGLGVIDDLDLQLHDGLNVLTGETGAGKTMVTVGLALALGARGGGGLVREGAAAARVQARFDNLPGGAALPEAWADAWAEDGELVLARTVGVDGKSTARIGGQLATASSLGELGRALVEVHGQHQAQGLLSTATQTAFLDRSAGGAHEDAVAAYRDTWDRWRIARTMFDELTTKMRERERELDLLAYQVREITSVAPRVGETDDLAAEEARLAHVERLLALAAAAEDALVGEASLADGAGAVAAALDDAARHDPGAGEVASRARGLSVELDELARDVRSYRESLVADPPRLQEVRERLATLKALQRKYGATDQDVLTFLEDASLRMAALASAEDRLAEVTGEVDRLTSALGERAGVVTDGRMRAAPDLGASLQGELVELGMAGATVEVGLEPTPDLEPSGAERVEIRLSPAPGQRAAPLAKTASGGELSRTMLACRSVLADLDDVPTLVFDEVDAGIGGEAGLAVGRRLARLAKGRQVLVVTHLPQIASFADRHILVTKDDGTATVRVLSDDERPLELSRMLAGLTGSEGAVTHAEELLAAAATVRSSPG